MRKIILLLIPLFIFMTCNEEITDTPDPSLRRTVPIDIEFYDNTPTIIEIRVTIDDTTSTDSLIQNEFSLYRNDSLICFDTLYSKDTIIVDNNLEPNTEYRYTAENENNRSVAIASTMDIVNHNNFTYTFDTLGISNHLSIVRDSHIFGENNIVAVGDFVFDDTTRLRYANVMKWDGNKWSEEGIVYDAHPYHSVNEIYSIFALSENDIWYSTLSSVIHFDGNDYHSYPFHEFNSNEYGETILDIWGTTSDNIYFAGERGLLIHWNGNSFTNIETNTDIDLHCIAGTPGSKHVFITAYNRATNDKSIAFHIIDGKLERLFETSDQYGPHYLGNPEKGDYGWYLTVQVFGNKAYFKTGGTDFMTYDFIEDNVYYIPKHQNEIGHIYLPILKGVDKNSMGFVTETGRIYFYNGESFTKYSVCENMNVTIRNADYKDNIFVIVGDIETSWLNWAGLVVRGKIN